MGLYLTRVVLVQVASPMPYITSYVSFYFGTKFESWKCTYFEGSTQCRCTEEYRWTFMMRCRKEEEEEKLDVNLQPIYTQNFMRNKWS